MAVLHRCPWPLAVGLIAMFPASCKKTLFSGRDSTEPSRKQTEKSPGEVDASKGGKTGDPSPNELDAKGNPKTGTSDGTARGPNGELLPANGTGTLGQNGGAGGTVGGTQRGPTGEILPAGSQSGTGGGTQTGTGTSGGTASPNPEPFPTGGTNQGGGSETGTGQGPTGGVPGGTVDCGSRFQTIQTAGGPITVDTSYNPTTPLIVSQASSKDTTCTVYVRESVSSQGTNTTTLVLEGQGLHYSYKGTEQSLANTYRYCAPSARGLAVGVSEKIFAIASPVPTPGSLTPASTQNGACVARKVIDGKPSPDNTWYVVIP